MLLNCISYLLSNGCEWRSLPPEHGDYRLVWYYLNHWAVYGMLDQVPQEPGFALRKQQGRREELSLLIVDAQAVKTTAGKGDEVGYDTDKNVKERKWHIATDTQVNDVVASVRFTCVHAKTDAQVLLDDVEDCIKVKVIVDDSDYKGTPSFDHPGTIVWQIIL